MHFDFIHNWADAHKLLQFIAAQHGRVINLVPVPHIWEAPASLKILKNIFDWTSRRHIQVIITRIDARALMAAPTSDSREYFLYSHILTDCGRLPSGQQTPAFFLATVGNHPYEQWLREETEYYARHFSHYDNLIGFSLGMFNEPFVSQRGSLLCYDQSTNSYELAQYTTECRVYWQGWLQREYMDLTSINRRFDTHFDALASIPMPKNETDSAFSNAQSAYWDACRAINDWVRTQYNDCKALWHRHAGGRVPFILQFSAYVPEKLWKGRSAFAALDIFNWMADADALGLSLYTNAEYPDWGHASDRAMLHWLRLATLLQKPFFILEGGNENQGPIFERRELDFFHQSAQMLPSQTLIYEFLKTPDNTDQPQQSGALIASNWRVRPKVTAAVKAALTVAAHNTLPAESIYVLDAPGSLAGHETELRQRIALMALSATKPLVFVPQVAWDKIPTGSVCLSWPQLETLAAFQQFNATSHQVQSVASWLTQNALPMAE